MPPLVTVASSAALVGCCFCGVHLFLKAFPLVVDENNYSEEIKRQQMADQRIRIRKLEQSLANERKLQLEEMKKVS